MAKKPLPWFRAYPEAAFDTKFEVASIQTGLSWLEIFGIWWKILCLAGNSPKRGYLYVTGMKRYSNTEVASILRLSNDLTEKIIATFIDLELLELDEEGAYHIKNWEKRQFESDSSTERVRNSRKKAKNDDSNGDETLHGRYSNAGVTPPDNRLQNTELNIAPDGASEVQEPNTTIEGQSAAEKEDKTEQPPAPPATAYEMMFGDGREVVNPRALNAVRIASQAANTAPDLEWCPPDVKDLAAVFVVRVRPPVTGEHKKWIKGLQSLREAGLNTIDIQRAIEKMRGDNLTIGWPGSLQTVALDLKTTPMSFATQNDQSRLLNY